MITVYIQVNQLRNFLINKEPIQLFNNPVNENYFQLQLNTKDLVFTEYPTYITIELKSRRIKIIRLWRKLWKRRK